MWSDGVANIRGPGDAGTPPAPTVGFVGARGLLVAVVAVGATGLPIVLFITDTFMFGETGLFKADTFILGKRARA